MRRRPRREDGKAALEILSRRDSCARVALLATTFNKSLWTRRAAWDIDIHWNNGINPLDRVVAIVKFTARVRTLPHTQNPLRFWHLLPKQTQTRTHFD